MTRLLRLTLLSLLAAGTLRTQQADRDSGRLVVRRADAVVGQEEFSLERLREADGTPALNLLATASYPPDAPRRVVASFGTRRITVRVASGTTEAAREHPGGERALVVAEQVLSLYVVAGGMAPGSVQVYGPGATARRAATLEDRGEEPLPQSDGRRARHLVLRAGDETTDLWFDAGGRLMRVAIPGQQLVAERLPQ